MHKKLNTVDYINFSLQKIQSFLIQFNTKVQAASVNRAFVEIVDVQLFVEPVILSRYQGEGAY